MRVEFASVRGQCEFLHRHGSTVHGRGPDERDRDRKLDGDGVFEHRRERELGHRRLKQ
jgi:hypothetical protein